MAQPSLSAQIAQAEEALSVQLFERDRRGVVLTAAGEALVDRARALLVAADALVESARSLADPFAGILRVGVIPTIAPYLLPELAPGLRARYPRMSFVWAEEKTTALIDRLARAEIDAALVAVVDDVSGLPRVVIGKDPFVFAAPRGHRLAASRRPIKADDLEGERVLLLDDGHCFREQALSFCARAGAEEAAYRSTSLATLVQMTAGGAGVTLLPSLALGIENRRDALAVRPFAPRVPSRTLALVWRRGSAREAALKRIGEDLRADYAASRGAAG